MDIFSKKISTEIFCVAYIWYRLPYHL